MNEYLKKAIDFRPRGLEAEAAAVGFGTAIMELGRKHPDLVLELIDRAEEYAEQSKPHLIWG